MCPLLCIHYLTLRPPFNPEIFNTSGTSNVFVTFSSLRLYPYLHTASTSALY
ncbi:hypothetical protein AOQ84DRAFT_355513 [Glonium stellatum]|uniref:Uncharacterized protein n=1 Tax=Glonium stellatum TaxID=574774 RepID=A0A8E2EWV0_9PEZI|nr:hypothetical protein AOQ84DRAFT_355513 [Glonium stellatum]